MSSLLLVLFTCGLLSSAYGAILSYPEKPYPSYSYVDSPPKYNFGWTVNDPYSGNDYGHKEARENDVTTGSYSVLLPDGRLQRVTYTVSGEGGYQAEVTYEGSPVDPVYYTSESKKDSAAIKTVASEPFSSSPVKEISLPKTYAPSSSAQSAPPIRKYTYKPISNDISSSSPATPPLRPLESVVVTNPLPITAESSIVISTTPAPSYTPRKKYTYKIQANKPKRNVHLPRLFNF